MQYQEKKINETFTFDESPRDFEFVDLSHINKLEKIISKSPQPKLRYLYASRCNIKSLTNISRFFTRDDFDYMFGENDNLSAPPPPR